MSRANRLAAWSVRFEFHGRRYTLFRRKASARAPFYIRFQLSGDLYKRCLETSDPVQAVERAKDVILRPGHQFPWQEASLRGPGALGVTADDPRVFELRGRRYRVFQREPGGAWYFHVILYGQRAKRSCGTDLATAKAKAASLISELLDAAPAMVRRRQDQQAESVRRWDDQRLGRLPAPDVL